MLMASLTQSAPTILSVRGLSKSYSGTIHALRGIDIEVKEGEFLVILGPSGAGKSTLMRCFNRLVEPTEGKIFHNDVEMTGKRRNLRTVRRQFGMVFQQFNLVKRLSVLTNVLTGRLAYRSTWRSLFYNFSKEDKRIAIECLARVNMDHKAFQRADTLSGGEQQRVAIARALANDPLVVLADEPTGNLDAETGKVVLKLLDTLTRQAGKNLVMVTHSEEVIGIADRVLRLKDGKLI